MKEKTKGVFGSIAVIIGFVAVVLGFVWGVYALGEYSSGQTEKRAICEYEGGIYEDKVCHKTDGIIELPEN